MDYVHLPVDSSVALQTWWHDGGKAWLESELELGVATKPVVMLPPDVRKALPTATGDRSVEEIRCNEEPCLESDSALQALQAELDAHVQRE